MKKYTNRRSIILFLLVFLCVASIACASVAGVYTRAVRRGRTDYERTLEDEMERVFSRMEQLLESAVQTANSVFASQWYGHFINVADVYANEFGGQRHSELVSEMSVKAALLPFVSEVTVIIPSCDSVISSKGWFSLSMYQQVYPAVTIDTSAGNETAPVVTVSDEGFVPMVVQDSTMRRYKSVVCLMIDKKAFLAQFQSMLGPYALSSSLTACETALTQLDASAEDAVTLFRASRSVPLEMAVAYAQYDHGDKVLFMALVISLLAVSALLSAVVTMAAVKPVSELVLSFGGEEKDLNDPFRFIYEYVNAFSKHHARLNEENDQLRAARSRFLSIMRNEIVLCMLTNPDFDFSADYIRTACPWIGDGLPFVIAACLSVSRTEDEISSAAVFCPASRHICWANVGNERWFIVWFDNEEKLNQGRKELAEMFAGRPYCVSTALRVTSVLHEGYLSMKDELDERRSRWMSLPMLLQTRLVSRIRSGKREEALETLGEALQDHSTDAVMWTLARLAGECGFEMGDYMERYRVAEDSADERRQALSDCLLDLCRFMTADRSVSVSMEVAANIRLYIDAHYQDSELSVNQLADVFSMHRTLISRAVKLETGETFTDYLLQLRMKRAAELLREESESIAAVGKAVGIPNYATFKRAFIKVYGCTPKEWRAEIAMAPR